MIDWRHWHNEPYLIGGLILLGWWYAVAIGPLRWRLGGPATPPVGKATAFYGALLLFYLAVGSPLDQIGERFLLSAHMLQHLLLVYPAAALLVLGLPPWLLPAPPRSTIARGLLRALTAPLACGLIFTLTITAWHAPALYEWALQNKIVHVTEHLMLFGAALFFWWPLLRPSGAPPLAPALQILYLLGVVIGMTPLFAFIVFSPDVLYPTYEYAPRIVPSLDASADQLLAGVGMKLGGMAVALLMMAVAFQRWYSADQRPALRGPFRQAEPAHSAGPAQPSAAPAGPG